MFDYNFAMTSISNVGCFSLCFPGVAVKKVKMQATCLYSLVAWITFPPSTPDWCESSSALLSQVCTLVQIIKSTTGFIIIFKKIKKIKNKIKIYI